MRVWVFIALLSILCLAAFPPKIQSQNTGPYPVQPKKDFFFASVDSYLLWNDLISFNVSPGSNITIFTNPSNQSWTDWYYTTSADGYETLFLRPLEGMLRYSFEDAKFFALVCCVGKSISIEACRKIGTGPVQFQAAESGALSCFANDVKGFYWNNYGVINVTLIVET